MNSSQYTERKKESFEMASGGHLTTEKNAKKNGNNIMFATNSNLMENMQLDQTHSTCDMRNSLNSANINMMKIYLQSPYKMLLNKKNRNNIIVQDRLFRADNFLQLHTQYRNQEPIATF